MGQSFLTHDEKSSQSPSPDLLQFNGVSNRKFFGSLSSVKETSVSGSSRSPLDSTDSERNFCAASSSSSSSPQSPPQIATTDSYSSLVPSPIQPGNVSRLREKFMDFDVKQEKATGKERKINTHRGENEGTISELDYRFLTRPTTGNTSVSINRCQRRRGTLPSSPRSRSSLHALSPTSRNVVIRNRVSLPASPAAYEKLDVIRSDNNLSTCFRQMRLETQGSSAGFSNEIPLVRQRPRARPYVPQPRSVIIRAGYLPVVQTVDVISRRPGWISNSTGAAASFIPVDLPSTEDNTQNVANECFITSCNTPKNNNRRKEDLLPVSSCATSTKPPLEEHESAHVVTNQGVMRTYYSNSNVH